MAKDMVLRDKHAEAVRMDAHNHRTNSRPTHGLRH